MKITKKILSMILTVVMVLGLLPATAFATATGEDVVYLSISFDGKYIDDKNGEPIVYLPVPMEAIEAIDLTEYGLDNMLYDADDDGEYETTALQLFCCDRLRVDSPFCTDCPDGHSPQTN